MDKLANYREIMEKVLTEYGAIPYSHGDFISKVIVDRNCNNFLIMNIGWDGRKRVHGCLVHLELIDGKIWIQRDGIEYGIGQDLLDSGIPKEDIVLAFHNPDIRKYTGFAVG